MSRDIRLFGIEFDTPTFDEAVAHITRVIAATPQGSDPCRFVFPVNVDVVVQIRSEPPLRQACAHADLVVIDGKPVVWLGRLFREKIPGTVTGSDLVPALFAAARAERPLKVFLLGAAPGVAQRAAEVIESRWPAVRVTGVYSPPLGFERDAEEQNRMVDEVNRSQADLLVIGLGAPKQEIWIDAHRAELTPAYAVCAGATIDFLAGVQRRAPPWMRQVGLEWLYRLSTNPRRLWRRYWRDFRAIPALVWEETAVRWVRRPNKAVPVAEARRARLEADK